MPGNRFYSTSAWRRFRAAILRARPICQVEGCGRTATHVDHVVAIAAGGPLLDAAGVQALCAQHHSSKTAQADGGFGNPRRAVRPLRTPGCGPDGMPLDPRHRWRR